MDDDIRDRFRGVARRAPAPGYYGRSARPVRPAAPAAQPQQPAPRPVAAAPAPAPARPAWPPAGFDDDEPAPAPKPQAKAKPPKAKRQRKAGKSVKKKLFLVGGGLSVLAIAAVVGLSFMKDKKKDQQFQAQLQDSTQQTLGASTTDTAAKPTGTIRLIAVGDNLAFDSVNGAAKQADGSYNYLPMMQGFKQFFDKSDIRVCGESTPGGGDKNGLAVSGYPNFNAPTAWSTSFVALGCNVISLASNHINDKGQAAIDSTLSTLEGEKNVLAVAGANRSAEDQGKIRYFSVKGLKFAYLAYTTGSANAPSNPYSVNIYSDATADKQIAEARKNAQLVLVSMYWGKEDSNDIDADQDRIAQHLADQNVDVILGGGPHALQPAKILTGKDNHQTLAWFSLGNFLNSELQVNNLIGGMAIMDFDAATQQIKDPKLMPLYMHYEWTAAQKAAGTVNARKNLMLYPLDLAKDALAKSQNNTTVDAQTARVTSIITKFAPIKVIKSSEF